MSCEKADVPAIPATLLLQVGDGICEVALEEVVKGTLPAYFGADAPAEALKALAIAVRSGAAVSRRHAREGFDLCTGGHCLAWQPAGRSSASDQAADETAGQVLVAAGAGLEETQGIAALPYAAAAPFFPRCDGRTRSSEEAWGSPLGHCRSAPCACGGTSLEGDGVGLCLAGAVAMAGGGATAAEILQHYYTGVSLVRAAEVPRGRLCQSLIVGRTVDSAGRPFPGVALCLSGPAGPFHRTASADGRFWISGLPAGEWELAVKGTSIRQRGLHTDGRSTLEAKVVIPGLPPLEMETLPLAYPKELIGTLGFGGVPVIVADSKGSQITVESGSAPAYDPGGFAVSLPLAGACNLSILGQSFSLEIGETGVWVRFSVRAATDPS